MKKILKVLGIILLVLIVGVGITLYYFRGQIGFYIKAGNMYKSLNDKEVSMEVSKNLKDTNSMDFKDVTYKNIKGDKCSLDIYGAKKKLKGGSPVILYVHGGSWIYGSSKIPVMAEPLLNLFREEGYTIISVDYKLTTKEIDFYKQAADVKDAIRWVYKNKEEYDFNTGEIGIIGASAGAHLAMLAAYSENNAFEDDSALAKYPSQVKWIVDLFGPTELKTLNMSYATGPLGEAVLRREKALGKEESIESYMEKYSPINYIRKGLPKTLIIQGEDDKLVPYEDSLNLYNKSKADGNNVEMISLKNTGHDFSHIDKKQILDVGIKLINFVIFNTKL